MAGEDLNVEVGLTEAQYQKALARIEAQTVRSAKKAEASFARANKSSNAFARGGLRNVALQLSQVAQSATATGDPIRALAIQLPDLAIGFGTFGIAAGVAAGALLPLVTSMFDTSQQSEELKDALEALGTSMKALERAQSDVGTPLDDLVAKYGEAAVRAKELLRIQRDLAYLDSASALTEAVDKVTDEFGVLDFAAEFGADLAEELDRVYEAVNGINPLAVEDLADTLKISTIQAQLLAEQFVGLQNARGPEAQAEAARNLVEQLEIATGGVWNMDEGAREVYQALLQVEETATRVAAIDLASGIWEGADAASAFAEQLARVAAAETALREATAGGPDAARFSVMSGEAQRSYFENHVLPETTKVPKVSSSSRGGGGGSSGVSDQMREAERLFDSTRTAAERYKAEIEEIEALYAGGFVDADTYARAIEQVAEKYDAAVGAGAAFGELTGTLKDAILDFATTGTLAMDDLADSIRRAALEALLFGEGPLAGVFGSIGGGKGLLGSVLSGIKLPGFAGGGYTGTGIRSGGIDGRGGFPAILHPNETVIDHTRGGSVGASVTYAPVIDARGADAAVVAKMAAVMAADKRNFARNVQTVVRQTGMRGRG